MARSYIIFIGEYRMTISYNIQQSRLSTTPDDYFARVSLNSSVDIDRIIDRMIEQGSTITKADTFAVIEEAIKATESLLLDGFRVNFGGLVQLYPKIKGKFTGPLDSYNNSRHKLDVGTTPGARVRKALQQKGKVKQQESILPEPNIYQVFDFESDEINGPITTGGICSIRGNRLKFNGDSTDEGIYFIRTSDNSEVRISHIFRNMPKELVFSVPNTIIAEESYYLEVRTRVFDGADLRSDRFNATFTAA